MNHLLSVIIPHAVAVALSPMPIAALILLLLSNKAKVNSILFALGWVIGVILNVAIFAFLFQAQNQATHDKSTATMIINAALGLFLIFLAYKEWKSRPKPEITPPTPKWMQTIESISPISAFLIALGLITINAKNTVLNIVVGVAIASANSFSEQLTSLLIYAAIASSTIVLPVVAFLIMGKKLDNTLNNTRTWFVYNSATILFVLFLILGVGLLSKAFGN